MNHVLLEFPTEEIFQDPRMTRTDLRVSAVSMFFDERRVQNPAPNQCSRFDHNPIHRIVFNSGSVGVPSSRNSPIIPLADYYNENLDDIDREAIPNNIYIQGANYTPRGTPRLKPGYIWSDEGWVTYGDFMRTTFTPIPEEMIRYNRTAFGTRGMVWSPDKESDRRYLENLFNNHRSSRLKPPIYVTLISVENQHRVSDVDCQSSYGNFDLRLRVDFVSR